MRLSAAPAKSVLSRPKSRHRGYFLARLITDLVHDLTRKLHSLLHDCRMEPCSHAACDVVCRTWLDPPSVVTEKIIWRRLQRALRVLPHSTMLLRPVLYQSKCTSLEAGADVGGPCRLCISICSKGKASPLHSEGGIQRPPALAELTCSGGESTH